MARKKKTVESPEPTKETVQNKTTSTTSVGYKGNVVVKVMHDNKVISTSKKHNAGTMSLFSFFGKCLIGQQSDLSAYRPIKIKLYTREENSTTYTQRSIFCTVANTNIVGTKVDDATGKHYDVTYHFTLPYMNLLKASSEDKINYIILCNSQQTPTDTVTENDYCAEVYLDDETAIDTSEYTSNITLVIEWTLSISNK